MELDNLFTFRIGERVVHKASIATFGWRGAKVMSIECRELHQTDDFLERIYYVRVFSMRDILIENAQGFLGLTYGPGFYKFFESELIPFDQAEFDVVNKLR